MASLLNSINHLRKKIIPKLHRLFRKKMHFMRHTGTNPKELIRKLQTDILHEKSHKALIIEKQIQQ